MSRNSFLTSCLELCIDRTKNMGHIVYVPIHISCIRFIAYRLRVNNKHRARGASPNTSINEFDVILNASDYKEWVRLKENFIRQQRMLEAALPPPGPDLKESSDVSGLDNNKFPNFPANGGNGLDAELRALGVDEDVPRPQRDALSNEVGEGSLPVYKEGNTLYWIKSQLGRRRKKPTTTSNTAHHAASTTTTATTAAPTTVRVSQLRPRKLMVTPSPYNHHHQQNTYTSPLFPHARSPMSPVFTSPMPPLPPGYELVPISQLTPQHEVVPWSKLPELMKQHNLTVNSIPLGPYRHSTAAPFYQSTPRPVHHSSHTPFHPTTPSPFYQSTPRPVHHSTPKPYHSHHPSPKPIHHSSPNPYHHSSTKAKFTPTPYVSTTPFTVFMSTVTPIYSPSTPKPHYNTQKPIKPAYHTTKAPTYRPPPTPHPSYKSIDPFGIGSGEHISPYLSPPVSQDVGGFYSPGLGDLSLYAPKHAASAIKSPKPKSIHFGTHFANTFKNTKHKFRYDPTISPTDIAGSHSPTTPHSKPTYSTIKNLLSSPHPIVHSSPHPPGHNYHETTKTSHLLESYKVPKQQPTYKPVYSPSPTYTPRRPSPTPFTAFAPKSPTPKPVYSIQHASPTPKPSYGHESPTPVHHHSPTPSSFHHSTPVKPVYGSPTPKLSYIPPVHSYTEPKHPRPSYIPPPPPHSEPKPSYIPPPPSHIEPKPKPSYLPPPPPSHPEPKHPPPKTSYIPPAPSHPKHHTPAPIFHSPAPKATAYATTPVPAPTSLQPEPPVSTIFIQAPSEPHTPAPQPIHEIKVVDSSPTIPAPTQKPLSVVAAPHHPLMPHLLGPPNQQHPTYFDVAQPVHVEPKQDAPIKDPSRLTSPTPLPRRRRPRPTPRGPTRRPTERVAPLRPRPTPFQQVTLQPQPERLTNDDHPASGVNSNVTNEELVRTRGGLAGDNILVPTPPPPVRQSTIKTAHVAVLMPHEAVPSHQPLPTETPRTNKFPNFSSRPDDPPKTESTPFQTSTLKGRLTLLTTRRPELLTKANPHRSRASTPRRIIRKKGRLKLRPTTQSPPPPSPRSNFHPIPASGPVTEPTGLPQARPNVPVSESEFQAVPIRTPRTPAMQLMDNPNTEVLANNNNGVWLIEEKLNKTILDQLPPPKRKHEFKDRGGSKSPASYAAIDNSVSVMETSKSGELKTDRSTNTKESVTISTSRVEVITSVTPSTLKLATARPPAGKSSQLIDKLKDLIEKKKRRIKVLHRGMGRAGEEGGGGEDDMDSSGSKLEAQTSRTDEETVLDPETKALGKTFKYLNFKMRR